MSGARMSGARRGRARTAVRVWALLAGLAVAGPSLSGCAGVTTLETVMNPSPRLPAPVVAAGTVLPTLTSFLSPEYPELERRAGIVGVVIVRCLVSEIGTVTDAEVVGLVSPGLDAAALEATRGTLFVPGSVNRATTVMTVDLPVRFMLQ